MTALWPLQVAVVARLKGDAPLMAVITDVYDGEALGEEDEVIPPPYVTVGEKTAAPIRFFRRTSFEDTLYVHIHSQFEGDEEALQILELVNTALEEPLTLVGFGTARLHFEFATTLREADGWRHIPARYRVRAHVSP